MSGGVLRLYMMDGFIFSAFSIVNFWLAKNQNAISSHTAMRVGELSGMVNQEFGERAVLRLKGKGVVCVVKTQK